MWDTATTYAIAIWDPTPGSSAACKLHKMSQTKVGKLVVEVVKETIQSVISKFEKKRL